jgi:hypothetical protein
MDERWGQLIYWAATIVAALIVLFRHMELSAQL